MEQQVISKEAGYIYEKDFTGVEPFHKTLSNHDLNLVRQDTKTLQINLGLLCNQSCLHCHLDAGPARTKNMDRDTAMEIISYAERCGSFEIIDITGGAPELNPNLPELIDKACSLVPRVMLRSNLSALGDSKRDHLMPVLRDYRVVVVASLPSLNESQADSQRGNGIFQQSIETLKELNRMGYGQKDSGLELNLVSNPTGAFLPPAQDQMEKRFLKVLYQKWGIIFNNLYNFANVPLGRFRKWLENSDNLGPYLNKLAAGFNPCAVENVMCRTLVSVSWDGYFYDCDFNLARNLPMGGKPLHISNMNEPPEKGSPIAVADHCYTCTAGAGFT
ncbi:arsenosugar biosynthesis radical SAM (seleno)protein ArsS [Thermodesulfobacteriota bacterium]